VGKRKAGSINDVLTKKLAGVGAMADFIIENRGALAGLIVMAVFWLVMNIHSVKGNIRAIDKARGDSGMNPMTDEEKRLIAKVLRSSVFTDFIGPLIGGLVALIVVYL